MDIWYRSLMISKEIFPWAGNCSLTRDAYCVPVRERVIVVPRILRTEELLYLLNRSNRSPLRSMVYLSSTWCAWHRHRRTWKHRPWSMTTSMRVLMTPFHWYHPVSRWTFARDFVDTKKVSQLREKEILKERILPCRVCWYSSRSRQNPCI